MGCNNNLKYNLITRLLLPVSQLTSHGPLLQQTTRMWNFKRGSGRFLIGSIVESYKFIHQNCNQKHQKIRQLTSKKEKGKFLGMLLIKWKKFSNDEWNQGRSEKSSFRGRGNMCEILTYIWRNNDINTFCCYYYYFNSFHFFL